MVIGIIAVLIGILMPALAKARAAAEQSVCLSNLHQLALAGTLYCNDNKGYICPASQNTKSTDVETIHGITAPVFFQWNYAYFLSGRTYYYNWRGGYLGRYMQTEKILQCPSLKLDIPNDPKNVDYPVTHYCISSISAKLNSQIRTPSATVMFADTLYYTEDIGFGWPASIGRPSGHTMYSDFHGRHRGGCGGVSFYDGHAEMIRAAIRDPRTYINAGPSSQTIAAYRNLHIGELIPPWIKMTDIASGTFFKSAVQSYDYYFWSNKDLKQ